MSDGALSQEEIDSLLAGLDGGSSAGGAPAPAAARPGSALQPQVAQTFKAMLDSTLGAQSQNLSMITGLPVTVSSPAVDGCTRDALLRELPEEVLTVTVPFAGAIPGDHAFLMSKETALKIASLANKDESLAELDDMAKSAVQECVSTLTGTQLTVIAEKSGNRGVQSGVAEGEFGPKAMARLPQGEFLRAVYQMQIGDGQPERLVEVFALPFVRDVATAMGGGTAGMAGPQAAPQAAQMSIPMGAGGGMMPGFGAPMGQMGFPAGMMGGPALVGGMNPPNVQPVQFASLQMQQASPESGNIGLIMDVYMEMTVELGRTRKLIKEILGMGEGTIIALDKLAGEPVDILVNHKLIAKGEVVVIDENFGVRVTEIVSPMERMGDLS